MALLVDQPEKDILDGLPCVRFRRGRALAHRPVEVSRPERRLDNCAEGGPQRIESSVFPLVERPPADTRKKKNENQQQQCRDDCADYYYDYVVAHRSPNRHGEIM